MLFKLPRCAAVLRLGLRAPFGLQASYVAAVPQADVEMTEAEKGAAKDRQSAPALAASPVLRQEVEIKFPQLSKPYAPELEAPASAT